MLRAVSFSDTTVSGIKANNTEGISMSETGKDKWEELETRKKREEVRSGRGGQTYKLPFTNLIWQGVG